MTGNEALAGQSPPKKVKTEWEGSPSEELVKKREEAEAVKTDEDATKFFEQMTEMLRMYTANGDGQDVLISAEISDELEKILKGYSGVADDPDSLLGSAETGELGPPVQIKDESEQFFDWASFMSEDESASKAATPDLVHQSSSTKTSPGSGSDNESGSHGASISMGDDVKIVKPEMTNDPLEMSIWGAIDGGEGLYYEAQDYWKWDEPMPSSDLPWAIT